MKRKYEVAACRKRLIKWQLKPSEHGLGINMGKNLNYLLKSQ